MTVDFDPKIDDHIDPEDLEPEEVEKVFEEAFTEPVLIIEPVPFEGDDF